MRSHFVVKLGIVLILSALAPAWADTYTFNWANECYLRSGDAYSICFSGATGNAPSAGLYEETQTTSGGGIVITRLTGTTGTYVNQWAQNTNNTVELIPANGFSETGSFDFPVGYIYNQNSGGSTPFFQLGTGCTGASCTTTPFNMISLQLANNTVVSMNYSIEGFLNGVQVDMATGTLTTRDAFTTVNLNWNDVNTVEFVNMLGSDSWWLNNVVVSTPATTTPEPGSLVLLLTVLSLAGIYTHKMRGKKRAA